MTTPRLPKERIHIFLPKELVEYVDSKVQSETNEGYESSRSSVIRNLIIADRRRVYHAEEDSNR
jgi:metal-responsive CopG/Arc/MetJ family transcriptional regulator